MDECGGRARSITQGDAFWSCCARRSTRTREASREAAEAVAAGRTAVSRVRAFARWYGFWKLGRRRHKALYGVKWPVKGAKDGDVA